MSYAICPNAHICRESCACAKKHVHSERCNRGEKSCCPSCKPCKAEDWTIDEKLKVAIHKRKREYQKVVRLGGLTYAGGGHSGLKLPLKDIRIKMGVSQAVFSKMIGVAPSTLGSWEVGTDMSCEYYESVSRALEEMGMPCT